MISYLEGKILEKEEKFFTINVSGVGYKIFSHTGVLLKIPEAGRDAKVWTHLYVREEALDLYGFLDRDEL